MEEAITTMINFIFKSNFSQGAVEVLTKTPSDFATAWSFISTTYANTIRPIGYGLIVLYFLIALADKSTTEQFNLEQFFKLFVRLIVVKFVIDNGFNILTTLLNAGNSLTAQLMGTSLAAGVDKASDMINLARTETNGFKLIDSIGFLLQLVIPFIGTLVIQIVVRFICYSRLLEIMIRTLVAPLALGDMFTEGMNGTAYRYLKNYFAVCLQGAIIFAISVVFSNISNDILTNMAANTDFIEASMLYLTMGFANVALIVRSLSLSKELVGTA